MWTRCDKSPEKDQLNFARKWGGVGEKGESEKKEQSFAGSKST